VTGPTPGDLRESLAGFIVFRRFLDDPIHLFHAGGQLPEFYLELRPQNTKNNLTHLVPLLAQGAPEKVRSTAGLHANQLHLQICGECQQLGTRTSLADHHPTG
jgi:hypothetical protein